MASIYRRGKVWHIRWREKHGERRVNKSESLGVTDKKAALRLLHLKELQLRMRRYDPDNITGWKVPETLYRFLDAYLAHLQTHDIAEVTKYDYRNTVRIFRQIAPDIQVRSITRRWIETKYLPYLRREYSPATVRGHMLNMRQVFGYALRWEIINRNPFSGLVPRMEKKLPVKFTDAEVIAIKEFFEQYDDWRRTYFLTILQTPNRRREHMLLEWERHVRFDEKALFLTADIAKGRRDRIVPLNDTALALFAQHKRILGVKRVFPGLTENIVSKAWAKMRTATGIPHKLHNTRSNWASRFVEQGGSLTDMMQIAGWEDHATAKLYLAFSPENVLAEKNRMEI